ncbi:hypothetical protein RvY_00892 [Ramazzottius varieornatus]|uniref:DCD domain-containing protein n=1 Tax=Ramazzottius varieornatus TaxID=947166 RepID=A0A1D1UP55_RAMVA|nr:hypothetical protein RvY_00892 [Ramazzottius varieornatus]
MPLDSTEFIQALFLFFFHASKFKFSLLEVKVSVLLYVLYNSYLPLYYFDLKFFAVKDVSFVSDLGSIVEYRVPERQFRRTYASAGSLISPICRAGDDKIIVGIWAQELQREIRKNICTVGEVGK